MCITIGKTASQRGRNMLTNKMSLPSTPVLRRHDGDIAVTHSMVASQQGAFSVRGPCYAGSGSSSSSSEHDSSSEDMASPKPAPQRTAAATLHAIPVDEEAEAERDRMLEVYRRRCEDQERQLQGIQQNEPVHVITPISVTVVELDEADATESNTNQIKAAVKTLCCKTRRRVIGLALTIVVTIAVGVILGFYGDFSSPGDEFSECFKTSADLRKAVKKFLGEEDTETTYGPIATWCVSEITDFSLLFSADENPEAALFNESISSWDMSSATRTGGMFLNAAAFDQHLSNWTVSRVSDMHEMFYGCSVFNQNLSSWNVSNVETMDFMFKDAVSFNGNVSTWNVALVDNMWSMFDGAATFNQNVSSWNVSQVKKFTCMFHAATSFDQDLSEWVVASAFNMHAMFKGATSFDSDLSKWSVSEVADMSHMFEEAVAFNHDISTWDVSNVADMEYMFQGAEAFNGNVASWDVSRVNSMENMFNGAIAFNQDLCQWGKLLSNKKVKTKRMFIGTSCPNQTDPDLNATPPGPFCHSC